MGRGYNLPQLFQNSISSKENDKSPRLRNWFDQKRSEKLNIPFLEPKAYGGDMDYAQIGENYPYDNDQRFSSDMSNFNVPPGYFKDINTGGYKNFAGESWNPKYSEKFQLDANVTPDNSFTLDETYKNPITGESPGVRMGTDGKYVNEGIYGKNGNRETASVDYKGKATNANNLSNLNKFNTGVSAALSIYGGIGERERLKKMYENYASDSIYGNSAYLDRGTYEANSGLFKPDEMGFKGVAKYGGGLEEMAFGGRRFMNRLYDRAFEYNEDGQGPAITNMSANRKGLFRKNYDINFEPPQNTGDWMYTPGDVYSQSTTPFTSRYAAGTDAITPSVPQTPSTPQAVTTPVSTPKTPNYRYGVWSATGKTPAGGGDKPAASLTLPSSYKEGGVTYMSEDQVRKFLEEGGELEFV